MCQCKKMCKFKWLVKDLVVLKKFKVKLFSVVISQSNFDWSKYVHNIGATAVSPPPPPFFFMIDYDREFHADSEKYKNIALKINGKCSNSTSKF